MEQTLDSIRPSDATGDLTYMYARDPSILAYSQRPLPVEKKNLISLYEEEDSVYPENRTCSSVDPAMPQTIKVYLRLKPFPRKLKLSKEETEAYQITGPTTLLTKLPSLDHTTSSAHGSRMPDTILRKFTFSHTFGPETTQAALFEQVIQQKITDFIAGHNATVMTYGTTNSGKSYTLQGTTTSPGIIPRGLEFVFSNINTRPTPSYRPTHNCDVVSLSPVDRAQELESKNKLLTFASVDKHAYINAYKQMQKLLQEESPIRPSQACDAQYSVWVSFAEIYNENVYDLLSNDCQKRRPLLKLGMDSQGQAFIKGLKTVCVNSGSEAYQVLMAGQYNLKVAATALNARSSRSHCIFTIKLLKYYVENNPDSVEVSTFSFCDLAGSERLKKTLNVGERLKEAQNINTSLLVLGRCLKSIYEGQSVKQRNEHVGPFRESKLTRLFQRALSGKEEIVLIVNVNPIPNLYVETQNVLNFSAIAKKIVVEPKKSKRKLSNSRFSQIVAQSGNLCTDWNDIELTNVVEESDAQEDTETSVFVHQDEYDEILDENKKLKKEIGNLKASMFKRDLEIRQELADMYTAMMKKLENDWKNRIKDVEEQKDDYLEWSVTRVENFYKEKINELRASRKRQCSEDDDDNDEKNINDLKIENAALSTKVQTLKQKVKKLRENNEAINADKNKYAFELGLTKEELNSVKTLLSSAQKDLCNDNAGNEYIDTLRRGIEAKQDRIKTLKEFLDDAKNDYIQITSDAAKMENLLKQKEEDLLERQERISDLEELLEQVNVCLAESTKEKETLEERCNHQANQLCEADRKAEKMQAKLIEAENTMYRLQAYILSHDPASPRTDKADSIGTNEDSMLSEGKIKRELLSESDNDISVELPKTPMTKGIVIKTDNDGVLEIPVTTYEDDRASEMFAELREIPVNENNTDVESNSEDLRAKLQNSEAENTVLKTKLSQSFVEIRSLKESLDLMKNECDEITKKLDDLKNAQDMEMETKTMESSPLKVMRDQASSPGKIHVDETAVQRMESGSQTANVAGKDGISQTSFVDQGLDELLESQTKLRDLRVKYDELETQLKEKVSLVDKLEKELESFQLSHDSLKIQSATGDAKIEELLKRNATLTETFKEDLAVVVNEKETVEKSLRDTENLLKSLEAQMNDCRDKHELKISDLEMELRVAKGREENYTDLEKAHAVKISEIEKTFQQRVNELEGRIIEITKCSERCEIEKKELEEKFNKNIAEMEILKKRLIEADKKEQEKDDEIRQLQKEIKNRLTSDVHDKKMQKELKETLKELNDTRETLRRTDDLYQRTKSTSVADVKKLENHIAVLEREKKMLESLGLTAASEKTELERLRRENEELVLSIGQKEQEMESFKKNRDETNAKWENLMKTKQEELERSKTEIKRFQEIFHRLPTTSKDKGLKVEDDFLKVPIPVVDLSNSDSKRTTRRAALLPPENCPQSEPKRPTRKRRLYQHTDECCIDLAESNEEIPPTPPAPSGGRSLRNRRK